MIECWRLKSDKLLQVVCNFSPVNKTNGSADLSQINHGNDNNRPKVWIMLCSIVFPLLCSGHRTTELEPGLLETNFFTRLIKIYNIFLVNKTNGSADLSQINHANDNNRPKVWIMFCSIVFPSLCSGDHTTELELGLLDTDFFTRLIKINNFSPVTRQRAQRTWA